MPELEAQTGLFWHESWGLGSCEFSAVEGAPLDSEATLGDCDELETPEAIRLGGLRRHGHPVRASAARRGCRRRGASPAFAEHPSARTRADHHSHPTGVPRGPVRADTGAARRARSDRLFARAKLAQRVACQRHQLGVRLRPSFSSVDWRTLSKRCLPVTPDAPEGEASAGLFARRACDQRETIPSVRSVR